MSEKPFTREDAQKMFDDSVRILREDNHGKALRDLNERLDRIEKSTKKEPQTPEEKAAAWDEYIRTKDSQPPAPPTPPTSPPSDKGPVPPAPKDQPPPPDPKRDWWWGDQ